MSHCGAIPVDVELSDEAILIDACLARVREAAGLEDESVLPPLHASFMDAAHRHVVVSSSVNAPSPEAIVRSQHRRLAGASFGRADRAAARPAFGVGLVVVTPQKAETTPTQPRGRAAVSGSRRPVRWPVFLCGFLAGVFGGVGLMQSPVGEKPSVQLVKKVHCHTSSVYEALVAKSRTMDW